KPTNATNTTRASAHTFRRHASGSGRAGSDVGGSGAPGSNFGIASRAVSWHRGPRDAYRTRFPRAGGGAAEHGYPVEVHRLVAESDLTVYVNTNYIRGFTRGWKSVCVGLSTWRTIRVTHTPDGMSTRCSPIPIGRRASSPARWTRRGGPRCGP